ncbi:hypothetical protein [Neisseria flavescens]|uniref:hypothetical protein n=1 Tax=Neisseria flavescens TaxID=484 RepID=UPI001CDC1473|nr:hypothetical protein [Neisseria flavescens]
MIAAAIKDFFMVSDLLFGGENIAAVADATYKRETVGAAGMCPLPLIQQGLH